MSTIKFDSKFDVIERAFKDNYKVRVGILGGKASEIHEGSEEGLTIAEVGAVHEFGSVARKVPQRSFLRRPLEASIMKAVKRNAELYQKAYEENQMRKYYTWLGTKALEIIDGAFASGFDWKPLQPETIARKGSSHKLIDKSELRRSISFQVLTQEVKK